MSLSAGTRLGPYEITAPLGEGGMGEVYRARDVRLGRSVAIKVLPASLAEDSEFRDRFRREARAASALNHENVAHIYDVGEEAGHHFIAMELVEGETLSSQIEKGACSNERIVDLALQMASALEAAHAKGVIHRDIKSANVVITADNKVKVLDFGLARRTHAEGSEDTQAVTEALTQVGVVVGTVPYMSPEQALGQPIDARTDIFSLGVVLYEMATGKRPFDGSSHVETLHRICNVEPESVASVNTGVAEGLARVINKCLAKDRDARYASATDLIKDLRMLAAGQSPAAAPIPVERKASGSRRLLVTAAITTAIVAVAAFFWMQASAGGPIDSIAVLPFENESNDPEIEYLCDGVTESLINTLVQVPELKVISRSSAFAFKGKAKDIQKISKQLGVRAVLVGRIVQRGEELSISAELIDVEDDRQLWGGRFNRPMNDLLAVETELTRTIAEKLRLELSGAEVQRVASRGTNNPEAYRAFLRGRHFSEGTADDMDKGLAAFKEAVRLDPDYALAHAAIGDAYMLRALHGTSDPEEALREARSALASARAVDPNLADAHIVAGNIALMFEWDWPTANQEFLSALESAPNSTLAHMEYAWVLWCAGDFDLALEHALKARDLDPLSRGPMHHVGYSYLGSRRYKQAVEAFQRTLEVHPDWVWGHTKLAMSLAYDGQSEAALEAVARAEELIATGGDTPLLKGWRGVIYAKTGKTDRAWQIVRELESETDQHVDGVDLAEVYTALGETDKALARLERAYADHSPLMCWVPVMFIFDPLRGEPRYQALVSKLNIPMKDVAAI